VRRTSRSTASLLLCAAVLAVGCGGDGDPGTFEEDAGVEAEAGDTETAEAEAPGEMPDVIGMHVDDAVAELEEAGFQVSTGIVRTTEVEPDVVYRSEPPPGRRVQEGQRVTLRIAAEPRS
jgi:hypothetical protein